MIGLRIRAWLWLVLPALLVIGLLVASDLRFMRYRLYPCQYELLWGAGGRGINQLDFAAITNSRGMVALDTVHFAEALRKTGWDVGRNGDAVVWDLGKTWRGPEFSERLVKDLLTTKQVDVLLLEYNLAKHETVRYHERSRFFLTLSDLAMLFLREDRDSLWVRMSSLAKMIAERVTRMAEDVLRGRVSLNPAELKIESAKLADCKHGGRRVNLKRLARREASSFAKGWEEREWQWDLAGRNQHLSTKYYQRIVKLAREHGTKVILFQVPEYFEPKWNRIFVKKVEATIGAPLITPSFEFRRELYGNPGNYHDPTHFTDERSAMFSKWLAIKATGLARQ